MTDLVLNNSVHGLPSVEPGIVVFIKDDFAVSWRCYCIILIIIIIIHFKIMICKNNSKSRSLKE